MNCVFCSVYTDSDRFALLWQEPIHEISNFFFLDEKKQPGFFFAESGSVWNLQDPGSLQHMLDLFGVLEGNHLMATTDRNYRLSLHPWIASWTVQTAFLPLIAFAADCFSSGRFHAADLHSFAQGLESSKESIYALFDRFHASKAKRIYKNLIRSGRFLDLSRLNEDQKHQPLERMAANLGCALETDPSACNDLNGIFQRLRRSAEWMETLLNHPFYTSTLQTKQAILHRFPQTVFQCDPQGNPLLDPSMVRPEPCTVNSTYSRLSTYILCPHSRLSDGQALDFTFPEPSIARRITLPSVDLIEDTERFARSACSETEHKALEAVLRNLRTLQSMPLDDPDFSLRQSILLNSPALMPWTGSLDFSLGGLHGSCFQTSKTQRSTYAGKACHFDFTSFFPSLAVYKKLYFQNGKDPMLDLYTLKNSLSRTMKETDDAKTKEAVRIQREGVKRVLNAGIGASDTTYASVLQMRHNIQSLRLIGQLITWRLAWMLFKNGGLIVSANTDGLYAAMDPKVFSQSVDQFRRRFPLPAKTEMLYLVSRDVNNRLECDSTGRILSASGADLSHWNGYNPQKVMSHPPAIDWILARYLAWCALHPEWINRSFDRAKGRELLTELLHRKDWPLFFQHVVCARGDEILFRVDQESCLLTQKTIRVFYSRNGSRIQCYRQKPVDPSIQAKRIHLCQRPFQHDLKGYRLFLQTGILLQEGKEIVPSVIADLKDSQPLLFWNRNLFDLSDSQRTDLKGQLDFEAYLERAAEVFEKRWQNRTPKTGCKEESDCLSGQTTDILFGLR